MFIENMLLRFLQKHTWLFCSQEIPDKLRTSDQWCKDNSGFHMMVYTIFMNSLENHLDDVDFLLPSATEKSSSKLKQSSVARLYFLCDLTHLYVPYTYLC